MSSRAFYLCNCIQISVQGRESQAMWMAAALRTQHYFTWVLCLNYNRSTYFSKLLKEFVLLFFHSNACSMHCVLRQLCSNTLLHRNACHRTTGNKMWSWEIWTSKTSDVQISWGFLGDFVLFFIFIIIFCCLVTVNATNQNEGMHSRCQKYNRKGRIRPACTRHKNKNPLANLLEHTHTPTHARTHTQQCQRQHSPFLSISHSSDHKTIFPAVSALKPLLAF